MIIHKTGTMLATGQGPGATPSGPESVTDGDGVRDPGVTAGAEPGGRGRGRNNKLGFKLKYLSGGGTLGAPEMERNRHRSWDGAGVERSCGDPTWDRDDPEPPGAASCLHPSLSALPLSDTNPPEGPPGPGLSQSSGSLLTAHPDCPSPQRGQSSSTGHSPVPAGRASPQKASKCPGNSAQSIRDSSPPCPWNTPGVHRVLPNSHSSQAELSVEQPQDPSFPPAGNAATALGTATAPNQGRRKGEASLGQRGDWGGAESPLGTPGTTTWGRKMQEGGSAGGHSAGEDSQTVKVAIPRHHFSPLISLH